MQIKNEEIERERERERPEVVVGVVLKASKRQRLEESEEEGMLILFM